jgi:hypothetical protein
MKSVDINGVTISIRDTGRYTVSNRNIFEWTIQLEGATYREDDLQSGCGAEPSETEMLETLLAFLGSAAESYRYDGLEGENSHLFPEPVVEWASEHIDEISGAQCDLELALERSKRAREALYSWHGGPGSAFYALASSGVCEDHFLLMKELAGCIPQDNEEAQELEDLREFLENDLEMDSDEDWVAPWHGE